MPLVFDRYLRLAGARHLDLATGYAVEIAVRDVLDEGWRRRWRMRVDTLMTGCAGLEPLADAGDAGRHAVFEVRLAPDVAPHRVARGQRREIAHAIAWLRARSMSPGSCGTSRITADGRLCADIETAWPIETAAEWRAARVMWRAWERLVGRAPLPRAGAAAQPASPVADRDDTLDERAGLVALCAADREALTFARASGRVALHGARDPSEIPPADRRRSMVIVGADRAACARWSAALAASGSRRHFYVPAPARAGVARERAAAYATGVNADRAGRLSATQARAQRLAARAEEHVSRGRLHAAERLAARAMAIADGTPAAWRAAATRACVMRLQGRAGDALALARSVIEAAENRCPMPVLIEAAEAATDELQFEQGEAFARAAAFAAMTAAEQARARDALDRARVWRGLPASGDLWQGRSAWHTWGVEPAWPPPGGYAHAPRGPLARWEWLCDGLERALWRGDARRASRIAGHLDRIRDRLPPLLLARIAWLARRSPDLARRAGATAILQTGKAGTQMEILEHLSAVLTVCHEREPEGALREAAAVTRRVLRARSVAVFVGDRPLPIGGDGDGWNGRSALASRCLNASSLVGPEANAAGQSAASPVRLGHEAIGAIVAQWPAHAELDSRRASLLLEAAALAMSPVIRIVRDRIETPACGDMPEIIGASPAIEAVRGAVRRVARVPFPVLIEGESGSGKELVARAIHRLSARAAKPFRALNCAAMAEDLVEAELFGHAQGAFTGASSARAGLFEDADQGTLFLDEVSELSARAQAKLLRVLQESEVRRVGETAARRIDVRIVAATNRPLRDAVAAKCFRADLSFRLDVLRVDIPPLRARPEDAGLLAAHFWREASARAGTSAIIAPEVIARLASYAWPGNVRELQNVIAALAVSAPKRGRAGVSLLPPHISGVLPGAITLHQARANLERDLVRGALARAGGKPGLAATELGLTRQGLAKLMRRLGMQAA